MSASQHPPTSLDPDPALAAASDARTPGAAHPQGSGAAVAANAWNGHLALLSVQLGRRYVHGPSGTEDTVQ